MPVVYGHVITKLSGMGIFTYPWCSAGALRAPELRYHLEVTHSLTSVFKSLTSETRNRRNKSNCNTVPLLFTLTHSSLVNCKSCSHEPILY